MIKNLLNALMGGASQQQQPEPDAPAGDPLADLLGSILSGDAQNEGDLDDALGAFLGGASQQSGMGQDAGGMDDMLGAVLGGAGAGSSSFLSPIVDALSKKLGLSPAMAQMVVGFAVNTLIANAAGGGAKSARAAGAQHSALPAGAQNLDLDNLLGQMRSASDVDQAAVRSTGLHQELSQRTDMDPDTAAESLQTVFQMLGGEMGGRAQAPKR